MSALRREEEIDPFARYEIVLAVVGEREPVVLRTAADADGATMAFYDERERLTRDQVGGDLLLVCHDEEARTLLREPLG